MLLLFEHLNCKGDKILITCTKQIKTYKRKREFRLKKKEDCSSFYSYRRIFMVTPFVCFWYFQPNKSWNTCCLCSWMRVLYSMHVGVYLYEIYMYSTSAVWRYSIFIKQVFQSFVLFLTDSVIDRPPPPIPGNQVQTNCIVYMSVTRNKQTVLSICP